MAENKPPANPPRMGYMEDIPSPRRWKGGDIKSPLAQLSHEHPDLVETITLARIFAEIVRQQQVDRLNPCLEQAASSKKRAWKSFSAGLNQNLAAVSNALTFLFSNGPAEGHVNRLKCIKRILWQGKFAFT